VRVQLSANNTFTHQQQNHFSPFYTQEHTQSTGLAASAPKKLSPPLAFLSPSSMKAAHEGTAIAHGSLLVSVKQEQLGMQAVSPMRAVGLSALAG